MARVQGIAKRAPRIDLRQPAVMIDSDGSEWNVTVLDVSSGGCRLQVPESPRIGEFVTLRVDRDEEIPVQIRWALGDQAGGVFLTAIGYDDWQAGGRAMAEDGDGTEDRRTAEERRQDERRQIDDRREVDGDARPGDSRKGQRRKAKRREGERRG
jgi:hypothetical protein